MRSYWSEFFYVSKYEMRFLYKFNRHKSTWISTLYTYTMYILYTETETIIIYYVKHTKNIFRKFIAKFCLYSKLFHSLRVYSSIYFHIFKCLYFKIVFKSVLFIPALIFPIYLYVFGESKQGESKIRTRIYCYLRFFKRN